MSTFEIVMLWTHNRHYALVYNNFSWTTLKTKKIFSVYLSYKTIGTHTPAILSLSLYEQILSLDMHTTRFILGMSYLSTEYILPCK